MFDWKLCGAPITWKRSFWCSFGNACLPDCPQRSPATGLKVAKVPIPNCKYAIQLDSNYRQRPITCWRTPSLSSRKSVGPTNILMDSASCSLYPRLPFIAGQSCCPITSWQALHPAALPQQGLKTLGSASYLLYCNAGCSVVDCLLKMLQLKKRSFRGIWLLWMHVISFQERGIIRVFTKL